MATLKEIAERSGFSLSTVSIVLRGNAEQRGITKATQDKIWEIAREMDYTPDIFARRLRSSRIKSKPLIALFWSSDFQTYMMARFLKAVRREILQGQMDCEVMIYTYQTGDIRQTFHEENLSMFNAAIICGASVKDIAYLEEMELHIPIVFYNRKSEKYPCVCMDNREIGRMGAEILARNGCRRVLSAGSGLFRQELPERDSSFRERAAELGIQVEERGVEHIDVENGYLLGTALCEAASMPDGIFFGGDMLAFGASRAFYQRGISVPEQVKLLSIGNSDPDYSRYSLISQSVIQIPMEEMARHCMKEIYKELKEKQETREDIVFHAAYVKAESCPL
ncbi:MAG: LacI family transcriptional regulator [Lachnospiraceae bacterium]|nr:LacI family transcriptional regulator [Lachnospiraceae bacterium]